MVRAGVVKHPAERAHSGYREIQQPRERYAIIDLGGLSALCGFVDVTHFQEAHRQWVEEALGGDRAGREDHWSEAIAVGSKGFVDSVQAALGIRARHREVGEADSNSYELREPSRSYKPVFSGETGPLRAKNTVY